MVDDLSITIDTKSTIRFFNLIVDSRQRHICFSPISQEIYCKLEVCAMLFHRRAERFFSDDDW